MTIRNVLQVTGSLASKMTTVEGLNYELHEWQDSNGTFIIGYYEMYPNGTKRDLIYFSTGITKEQAKQNLISEILAS